MTREPKQRGNARFTPCFKKRYKRPTVLGITGLRAPLRTKNSFFKQNHVALAEYSLLEGYFFKVNKNKYPQGGNQEWNYPIFTSIEKKVQKTYYPWCRWVESTSEDEKELFYEKSGHAWRIIYYETFFFKVEPRRQETRLLKILLDWTI